MKLEEIVQPFTGDSRPFMQEVDKAIAAYNKMMDAMAGDFRGQKMAKNITAAFKEISDSAIGTEGQIRRIAQEFRRFGQLVRRQGYAKDPKKEGKVLRSELTGKPIVENETLIRRGRELIKMAKAMETYADKVGLVRTVEAIADKERKKSLQEEQKLRQDRLKKLTSQRTAFQQTLRSENQRAKLIVNDLMAGKQPVMELKSTQKVGKVFDMINQLKSSGRIRPGDFDTAIASLNQVPGKVSRLARAALSSTKEKFEEEIAFGRKVRQKAFDKHLPKMMEDIFKGIPLKTSNKEVKAVEAVMQSFRGIANIKPAHFDKTISNLKSLGTKAGDMAASQLQGIRDAWTVDKKARAKLIAENIIAERKLRREQYLAADKAMKKYTKDEEQAAKQTAKNAQHAAAVRNAALIGITRAFLPLSGKAAGLVAGASLLFGGRGGGGAGGGGGGPPGGPGGAAGGAPGAGPGGVLWVGALAKFGPMAIAATAAISGLIVVWSKMWSVFKETVSFGLNQVVNFWRKLADSAIEAAKMFVSTGAEYERLRTTFQVLARGDKAGDELFQQIQKLASVTPYSVQQLGEFAQRLLGMGTASEEVAPILQRLGEISAGDTNKFSRLALAFGQVRAAGRLFGQELRQFTEAGIAVEDFAAALDVTPSKFRRMMREGEITFDMVAEGIDRLTSATGRYGGMNERILKTVSGSWSRLKSVWQNTIGNIFGGGPNQGESIFQKIGLADVINKLTATVQQESPRIRAAFVNIFDSLKIVGEEVLRVVTAAGRAFLDVFGKKQTFGSADELRDGVRAALEAMIQFGAAATKIMLNLGSLILDYVVQPVNFVVRQIARLAPILGGLAGMKVGGALGGTIGSILGPGGTVIGAGIGTVAGTVVGSSMGNKVSKGFVEASESGDVAINNFQKGMVAAASTVEELYKSLLDQLKKGDSTQAAATFVERQRMKIQMGTTKMWEDMEEAWTTRSPAEEFSKELLKITDAIENQKKVFQETKFKTPQEALEEWNQIVRISESYLENFYQSWAKKVPGALSIGQEFAEEMGRRFALAERMGGGPEMMERVRDEGRRELFGKLGAREFNDPVEELHFKMKRLIDTFYETGMSMEDFGIIQKQYGEDFLQGLGVRKHKTPMDEMRYKLLQLDKAFQDNAITMDQLRNASKDLKEQFADSLGIPKAISPFEEFQQRMKELNDFRDLLTDDQFERGTFDAFGKLKGAVENEFKSELPKAVQSFGSDAQDVINKSMAGVGQVDTKTILEGSQQLHEQTVEQLKELNRVLQDKGWIRGQMNR